MEPILIFIGIVTLLFLLKPKPILNFYKTIGRDVKAGIGFLKLNFRIWYCQRNHLTIPKIFFELLKKHPTKVALYFEDQKWTYQQLEDASNQVAHCFKDNGYKRGDSVALLMESRPEYVVMWLGLSKIGVITALINNNLVSDPLIHSIKVCNAKGIIFGSNYSKVIANIQDKLPNIELFEWTEPNGEETFNTNFMSTLKKSSVTPLFTDLYLGKCKDKLIFIYTSGTTGLPKAAVITHSRFLFIAYALKYMTELSSDDIIYNPLPLYHSAGGMVGVGQFLLSDTAVAIRKKFSASNFWSDCVKYNCTAAQYIGEMCRYILAAHAKDDKPIRHNVKKMCGNGLRPQIWKEFVDKFNIKQVYEFYGATEGNSNLINIDNKLGAVGFVPVYASYLYPVTLIKCDEATGQPIRDKNGFCTRCKSGESGVLIGKVDTKKSINNFEGYADKKATESKLIENVFKKGDLYFNSGDILIQDELGYYYFKDRTGDTFRWKGENVATSEVEAVVSNLVDFKDAVVYGVKVPETEGRCGMVAIVDTDNSLDIDKLAKNLKAHLPSYSIPIFLRVMRSVPLTGTFKLKKVDLQDEGFNLDKITDHLYFYDAKNVKYIELTRELYDNIMNAKLRL